MLETHEPFCAKLHADLALARKGTAVAELQERVEDLECEVDALEEILGEVEYDLDRERELKIHEVSGLEEWIEQLGETLELYENGSMWSDAASGIYYEDFMESANGLRVDDRVKLRDAQIRKLEEEKDELKKRCGVPTRAEERLAMRKLEARVDANAGITIGLKRKLEPYVEGEDRGRAKAVKVEDGGCRVS